MDSHIPSILNKSVFVFQFFNVFLLGGPKIKSISIQKDIDISQQYADIANKMLHALIPM